MSGSAETKKKEITSKQLLIAPVPKKSKYILHSAAGETIPLLKITERIWKGRKKKNESLNGLQ